MPTTLAKELKRSIGVNGEPCTVIVNPAGLRLVRKGKRKPQVQPAWKDLVNGDAALAVALRASVADEAT